MAAKLLIEIELDNEAMQRPDDVATAVGKSMAREIPHRDLRPGWSGSIQDANGKTVGGWRVTE